MEPRKLEGFGCRRCRSHEGNMDGRTIASARPTRRGQRHWHVWKLFARELNFLPMVKGKSSGAATPPAGHGGSLYRAVRQLDVKLHGHSRALRGQIL